MRVGWRGRVAVAKPRHLFQRHQLAVIEQVLRVRKHCASEGRRTMCSRTSFLPKQEHLRRHSV
jgi:hypothetical protein